MTETRDIEVIKLNKDIAQVQELINSGIFALTFLRRALFDKLRE